jgi:hypothetical protein
LKHIKNKYLFNFAVSHSGGGYKRLYEYSKWFNENGGAWFIIHPHCGSLVYEFTNNRFFLVKQPRYKRIFNDCEYLVAIKKEIGTPDMYYSYGIPIYARFGIVNWFHLSNVLPLFLRNIPISLYDRLKLIYLGRRIRRNFQNSDVISAESKFSLSLMNTKHTGKLFLSVNGSNDEILYPSSKYASKKDNTAVVLGTYRYKALKDSYHVFEMLRKQNSKLKLEIIGVEENIPKEMRNNRSIIVRGVLNRDDVVECLRKAKYYISTTYIENSYNAASEGVFFADESYISDIGPHRELLGDMPFDQVLVPNLSRPILHVRRNDLSIGNLKTWEEVIVEMTNHVTSQMNAFNQLPEI